MRIYLIIAVLMIGLAGAQDLCEDCFFVSPSGDDSNPGTFASPWRSPEKAWYTADAGDTVYFREGTYTITSTINTQYYGHHGTSDAPIVFRNYPGEDVTFTGDLGGPPMFELQKNYSSIFGINFIGSGFGPGSAIIRLGIDLPAFGTRIENCTFHIPSVNSYDNVCAIYFTSRSANTIVQNNLFVGPGNPGTLTNLGGIVLFRPDGVKIENNEFSDWYIGIYYKHSNSLIDTGISMSDNYIHDCQIGIESVANYAQISNNLILDAPIRLGGDAGIGNGYVGADYNTITHNTLVNSSIILLYETRTAAEDPNRGCLHNMIRDNILMELSEWHAYADESVIPGPAYLDLESDYNLYPPGSIVTMSRNDYSLSGWRSYNGKDSHSLSAAPIFTGDFGLAAGSPGKDAASDGSDMGAEISKVGYKAARDPLEDLLDAIAEWKRGEITITQVLQSIMRWKDG